MQGAVKQDEPQVSTEVSRRGAWRRKLPLRVSVRALMILVLLLGGVLGWVVHLASVQRDAISAIRLGGGHVRYNWQLKRLPNGNVQFNPKGQPKAPKWLLDSLGHDYFGHVEYVEVGQRNTDAVMKQVGQLDQVRQIRFLAGINLAPVAKAGLEALPNAGLSRFRGLFGLMTTDLSAPQINGANFKYLKNMTRLEFFKLPQNCSVTDADLTYLSELTALSQFEVHDSRITDAGVASLKGMTGMKSLTLSGTQVSGAGLSNLGSMNELKFLDLSGTAVDDLAPIRHLNGLTNLHLSRTPLDDRGLASVVGLVGLDVLKLDGINITGASYSHLKHLSKLIDLSLRQTRVGDQGSAALAELGALVRLELDETQRGEAATINIQDWLLSVASGNRPSVRY